MILIYHLTILLEVKITIFLVVFPCAVYTNHYQIGVFCKYLKQKTEQLLICSFSGKKVLKKEETCISVFLTE